MSRWLRKPVYLGLGSTSLALSTTDGEQLSLQLPWLPEIKARGDGQMRLVAALTDVLGRRPGGAGRPLRLVLADSHVRYWSQTVPVGTRSLAELRAVAMGRCVQLFGGSALDWRLTGDWHMQGRLLCMAFPAWIARAFESVGKGWIDSVLGQQLHSVKTERCKDGWVCFGGLSSGTVAALQAGRVISVRGFALDADRPKRVERIALELQRASLREGLAIGAEVSWFDALSSSPESIELGEVVFERRPLLSGRAAASCEAGLAAQLAMPVPGKGGAA